MLQRCATKLYGPKISRVVIHLLCLLTNLLDPFSTCCIRDWSEDWNDDDVLSLSSSSLFCSCVDENSAKSSNSLTISSLDPRRLDDRRTPLYLMGCENAAADEAAAAATMIVHNNFMVEHERHGRSQKI